LVQNNFTLSSGNEKIDGFIQEMQLNIEDHHYKNIVFGWIPYNQFNEIKEISRDNTLTLHSAIWKNGPLYYDDNKKEYRRDSNKIVALKYLQNSQNTIEILINEVQISPNILIFFF
jgi:hypothetical protein